MPAIPAPAATVLSDYKTRQSGCTYRLSSSRRIGGPASLHADSGTRDFGINAANLVVDSYQPSALTLMADYSWSEFSRIPSAVRAGQVDAGRHR